MPLHQHQDRVPHLDRLYSQDRAPSDAQLDHHYAIGEAQRTGSGSNHFNRTQQNIESDLPVAEDEVIDSSQLAPSKPKMLRELEAYNESPEPDSDDEHKQLRLQTARSSQRATPKPRRKSSMLRELEAHNQSPETRSESEVETLCNLKDDWRDAPLTRGASKDLENFVKGKPRTPRKNLNFKTLMLAEFSGMDKEIKKYYFEDSSILGRSSYQKRQECRKKLDLLNEEEDEELNMPKNTKTNGRNHHQPIPTSGTKNRQVEDSTENSQRKQKLAIKSAWSTWDNQKG